MRSQLVGSTITEVSVTTWQASLRVRRLILKIVLLWTLKIYLQPTTQHFNALRVKITRRVRSFLIL